MAFPYLFPLIGVPFSVNFFNPRKWESTSAKYAIFVYFIKKKLLNDPEINVLVEKFRKFLSKRIDELPCSEQAKECASEILRIWPELIEKSGRRSLRRYGILGVIMIFIKIKSLTKSQLYSIVKKTVEDFEVQYFDKLDELLGIYLKNASSKDYSAIKKAFRDAFTNTQNMIFSELKTSGFLETDSDL